METFKKYKSLTNMSYSQLLNWSKTPNSQKASLQPKEESLQAKQERKILLTKYTPKSLLSLYKKFNTAQIRNLTLLRTPSTKWDAFLKKQAKKAISYLSRAKKIKMTKKNQIALKNWGFDVQKSYK